MSKEVVIPWKDFFSKHKKDTMEMIDIIDAEEQSNTKMFSNGMIMPIMLTATTDKIDALGNNFLEIAYKAGFWIILIAGITQILRAVNEHDRKKIIETILTYALMYSALYMLPEAMRLVDSIFTN